MIYIYGRNILRFVFLLFLQVLLLNHIHLFGFKIYPLLYVIFILLMPFETPKGLLLLFSFAIGIGVDIFSNTFGLHAGAAVLAAFIRPGVLSSIAPRDGYEPGSLPRIGYYGSGWFSKYALFLIIPHHLYFFFLERFSFADYPVTLLNAFGSAIFTFLLIIISQYIFYRK